jgi:hypothetical protein
MGKNKTKKNNGIGGGVAFIIVGVLLLFIAVCIFIGDSDFIFNGADDINTMIEELRLNPGEYTSVRIDADFGAYAETQHTINGFIPAGKEQHYMVWLDDGSLISVTVKGKNEYDKMDAIEEQTYDYIDNGGSLGKSVTYVGKISAVSGDLKTYYQEALDYIGASDSDVNIYYLDIDTTQTKGSIIRTVVLFLAIGILLIVLGIVTIRNAKKQKAAAAQINSAAFSQNMAGNNTYANNAQEDNGYGNNAYGNNTIYGAGVNQGEAAGESSTYTNGYTQDAASTGDGSADYSTGYSSGFDSSFYNPTDENSQNN